MAIRTLPNSLMNPSAAPVTSRFPLWLKAVQLMATGSGSRENWSYRREKNSNSHTNCLSLMEEWGQHGSSDWLRTCCLTVLVSHSSSCPDTGMGSLGAESLPERLRAAAEQTKDEPLGLQARDSMLEETHRKTKYESNILVLCMCVCKESCCTPPTNHRRKHFLN